MLLLAVDWVTKCKAIFIRATARDMSSRCNKNRPANRQIEQNHDTAVSEKNIEVFYWCNFYSFHLDHWTALSSKFLESSTSSSFGHLKNNKKP